MFTVYYFVSNSTSRVVFTNDELAPCLTYINMVGLTPQQCIIVSPNKRRITFDCNNNLVFSDIAA